MERFSNGLRLVRASWEVLKADREFVLFAIVSAISAAILALLFSIPLWTSGFFARLEAGGSPDAASHMVALPFLRGPLHDYQLRQSSAEGHLHGRALPVCGRG